MASGVLSQGLTRHCAGSKGGHEAIFPSWLAAFSLWRIANELKIYGLHPTEWDVLYMSSVVVLTVGVRFGLALPERVAKTVEQLHNRGSLTGNPESLASAVVSRGDSWAHEGGLALAVVVAVSFSIAFWQIFPDQILFTIIVPLAVVPSRSAHQPLGRDRNPWFDGLRRIRVGRATQPVPS